MWPRTCGWIGTPSRRWSSSTCASNSGGTERQDPASLDSTRSRSAGDTPIASLSPISFASGRSGSGARIAPRRAWMPSSPWLGPRKSRQIRVAVMDMWKAFRASTRHHAPQASILFDKFHVLRHLGVALDLVRKSEYARLSGKDRRFIKGQKYTLLAHRENLSMNGRRALKTLLTANKLLKHGLSAQ